MSAEETVRQALSRGCLYYILSTLFPYPDEKTLSGLDWEEAGEAVALLGNPAGLKEAFESLKRSLKPADALRSDFSKVFGYTLQSDCSPYETQYGGGGYAGANSQLSGAQVFDQVQTLGDIAGFYGAFGLDVSDQAKERVDHISIELEFMAFLAYKEAYAMTSSDGKDKAWLCRDAQVKFVDEHLGKWGPIFTTRLEEAAKGGFYGKLARLTGMFLALEVETLGVQPVQVEGLAPTAPEAEALCGSCETKDACFSEGGGGSWGGAARSVF